ncbi:LysE family translocator [Persephonella atlantica]|uniref:LysE family translocator n=1 Tax=Persephonella atlantica TaxID=2699429 RepID=A0ABS1GHD1_9AQUI|nr:LysE family translocator [Persephonella atlantica]MBK3332341.1 LysE family translocator [Persephonella atlantica]
MMYIKDIFTGLVFGIGAGLSPGPLMALLISETIQGHRKNGILVSISPIITDIPILLTFLFLLEKIKDFEEIIGIISLTGALILFYFGYKNFTLKEFSIKTDLSGSLKKGVILNILNPYTYLFWFFIGAPYVEKAGVIGGALFTVSFFVGITGSMIVIVLFTEKLKKFLESRYYLLLLKGIGALFFIFGILLIKDGLEHLNVI